MVEPVKISPGPRLRCPECRGKKRIPGMIKVTNMGSGTGSGYGPCPTCDGLGYVPDAVEGEETDEGEE